MVILIATACIWSTDIPHLMCKYMHTYMRSPIDYPWPAIRRSQAQAASAARNFLLFSIAWSNAGQLRSTPPQRRRHHRPPPSAGLGIAMIWIWQLGAEAAPMGQPTGISLRRYAPAPAPGLGFRPGWALANAHAEIAQPTPRKVPR